MLRHDALQAPVRRRSALRVKHQTSLDPAENEGDANRESGPNLAETIRALILEYGDPARMLELYHWSREPGFGDTVRVLALLPAEKRAAIQSFLMMASDTGQIDVVMRESGELRLSSPEVAATLKTLRARPPA